MAWEGLEVVTVDRWKKLVLFGRKWKTTIGLVMVYISSTPIALRVTLVKRVILMMQRVQITWAGSSDDIESDSSCSVCSCDEL